MHTLKTIEINNTEKTSSKIFIQRGLKDNLEDFLEDKKYFLITNTTLFKLYPNIVKKFDKNRVIVIKDGEKYKNFKTYNYIIEKLLSQKIERKDVIVVLGGGVVGDLGAYCASSILRGVDLIQIPTTLLSMVDSSIGGKTGYNTKYGKNLVGSFYFASKVLIDPDFLNTLNDYEYTCGLGEVVKYAFIEKSSMLNNDFNLLNILIENDYDSFYSKIDEVIHICASIKANVVELDKKEGNLRKILNFGHTFAHSFETLSNYNKISHGEAVSMGIVCAFKLAKNLNKIDEAYFNTVKSIVEKYHLIKNNIKFSDKKVIELMKQDKKVQNGKINLVLPVALRQVAIFDNIDETSLSTSLL